MGEIEAGGGGLAWAGAGGWVRIGPGDGCGAQTFQVRGRVISMPHWKRSQLALEIEVTQMDLQWDSVSLHGVIGFCCGHHGK